MGKICPICGKKHDSELKTRIASLMIKGLEVQYEEEYFTCPERKGDNEYSTASQENKNLLKARNAYREKMGLLTSDEIVEIREKYGLSQVDLSQILGWGEATVSRYESKAIQDSSYDNVLRLVRKNPIILYYFYLQNMMSLNEGKQAAFISKLENELANYGRETISRNKLDSFYVSYPNPSEENGLRQLDIDKLENVVNYLAKNIDNLYKVKLMKMLWYIDVLSYRMHGSAITGLVYEHAKMGALPLGHDAILGLENILVQEEETDDYDNVSFHIVYNEKVGIVDLTESEKSIIDKVINKFKNMKTKEIVDYMHEEEAYKKTVDGELISFTWAKELRDF